MDKQQLRLILVLTVICVAAGAVLAWVNGLTEPRIEAVKELKKQRMLQESLPAAVDFRTDATLLQRARETIGPEICDLYLGFDDQGAPVGIVLTVESRGYGGPIQLMVGVAQNGRVTGISVLGHSETVGLGAKISEDDFLKQEALTGVTFEDTLAISKDHGKVQAVAGATISSRAVVRGVNRGLAAARTVLNDERR
ncbi:MAG TPA: RnfABCDGE type electron transport complex subunit G [Firmicutes bacterium]|nr:RnfABCDGE type electron transport complex subunit G [Bacillota bacterium]